MRTKMLAATLAAVASLAVLTACSDESSSSSEDFNDADVTFAQQMIPHHRQATEMAKMAEGRTQNQDVLDLAKKIQQAQGPEIETMSGWLESWGEDVPQDSDMGGMDHSEMGHSSGDDMAGMMTDEDMSALEQASGAEFDEMFLTMMIEHHKGAVDMAATEESDGKYPAAVEMAKTIQSDQEAEIEQMTQLLGR
ncbi:DUF305 domain-containing protein [Aeromicrobium massiliense]|uniref:DUF305 domain-containing protein n=1 Tax=Aeromicrobium massiliense TaxID=1464554 RepID=UPI000578AB54|nr:DUF305 domain-containing protein [Aeromicrobium massiliense]